MTPAQDAAEFSKTPLHEEDRWLGLYVKSFKIVHMGLRAVIRLVY